MTSSNVQFRMEVRTPAPSSCLLFQETHTVDLSGSMGVFSITLNDGTAIEGNTEPYSLLEAFQNLKKLTFSSSKCLGTDTEYTPNPADGRQLLVSFNDESFSGWERLPLQAINFTPMALEAMSLSGHRPTNLFRVQDPGGPLQAMNAWSVASYQKLLDLISNTTISGGNASIGGTAAGFTGPLSGDVTGGQASTRVEALQGRSVLDATPADQQVLTWNHALSRWEPRNVSVAGNPDWDDITGKPTSLPPSGAASGDLTGTYPNPTIADNSVYGDKIADGGVAFSKLAAGFVTGQVLRWDTGSGGSWSPAKLQFTDLVNAHGASPWPGACAAGAAIVWESTSDSFVCRLVSLNALLPAQSGEAGKFLQTDGTNVSWVLPSDEAGVTSINGASGAAQTFTVAQGETAPVFSTSGNTHTLNIPLASTAGVTSGTISHTDYQNFSNKQAALGFTPLDPANNLSELANTTTARTNLGLGTAATKDAGLAEGDVVEVGAGGKIPLSLLPNIPLANTTGILPITQGGTGAVSQSAAINALLPSQTSQAGKILQTDGANVSWVNTPATGITALTGDVTASGSGSVAATIANNAISTTKIANGAVTDVKIDKVSVNKIQSGAGLYLTYAPNGAACANGEVLKKTANGWECGTDSNAGGTVTSVTAGAGLTGGVITTTGTIGLGTELSGLNALGTTGFVKRTGAGTYSTSASLDLSSDVTGVLPIARGGTGAVSQSAAINALLPSQSSQAGKILQTDGTNVSWVNTPATGITALTGEVTASGSGSVVATIANNSVTSAKILDGTILGTDLDFTGVNDATTGFVLKDSTGKFANFACSTAGHIPTWTVAGFACQAPPTETDPKIGANTQNMLSKWDGARLVASAVHESGGSVGIGTVSPTTKLDVRGSSSFNSGDTTKGTIALKQRGVSSNDGVFLEDPGSTGSVRWYIDSFGVARMDNMAAATGTISLNGAGSGKVGIGTTSPTEKLEVAGKIKATELCIGSDCQSSWPSGGGGLTDFTESVSTSSPNASVPVVSLIANNAATNVDVALSPKGTGSLAAQIADSTTAGGNKRGLSAVDWQMVRSAAAQVASGEFSTVSGGGNNVASGTYSTVAGGEANSATGYNSFVGGGGDSTASGDFSTAGGWGNTAQGMSSTISGGMANQAIQEGATVSGGGGNTASGTYSIVGGGTANQATGEESTVGGGDNNTASGTYSIVGGGAGNRATGESSTVPGGAGSIASGNFSFAANFYTTASSYAQTTFGAYNMPKGGENATTWVATDPLFTIGNGTGDGASRSTAMMILKSGNVGIGTTSPTAKLQVAGAIAQTSDNENVSAYAIAGQQLSSATANGTYYNKGVVGYSFKRVDTGITDSGYSIGIHGMAVRNYTSSQTSDNGTLATLRGGWIQYGHTNTDPAATPLTSSATGLFVTPIAQSGTITNMYDLFLSPLSGGGTVTNRWSIYQQDPNTRNFFAGNVGIGTTGPTALLHVNGAALATAWNVSSDVRLKENIREIEDPLEKILRLRAVEFDWRSDVSAPTAHEKPHDIGVIAQEVERVFPEAVSSPEGGYKAVDYSKLVAPVIGAVKAIYQRLMSVGEELALLKIENEQLKSEVSSVRNENADVRNENAELRTRLERIEKMIGAGPPPE